MALGQEPDPQLDEEFRREMRIRSLYKFNKSCSDWLRRLDNHQRKEPIVVAAEWAAIQEEWIDRLGNLTLNGYNSKVSDRPLGHW